MMKKISYPNNEDGTPADYLSKIERIRSRIIPHHTWRGTRTVFAEDSDEEDEFQNWDEFDLESVDLEQGLSPLEYYDEEDDDPFN